MVGSARGGVMLEQSGGDGHRGVEGSRGGGGPVPESRATSHGSPGGLGAGGAPAGEGAAGGGAALGGEHDPGWGGGDWVGGEPLRAFRSHW